MLLIYLFTNERVLKINSKGSDASDRQESFRDNNLDDTNDKPL